MLFEFGPFGISFPTFFHFLTSNKKRFKSLQVFSSHDLERCLPPECLLFFVDDFDIATEFQFTLVGFWGFQVVHIYGNICQETGRGNGLQGINHGSLLCLILKLSVNFQPYFARPKSLWRAIFIQNWELTSQFWDLCLLDMNRYRDCSKI